ncbi:MAG TPA: cyclic nucleotide-binding domain-containing protein, partial [Candidatus Acidoferrales bacterium]|nr:cyclic nucleotide-binding domain-containing protein [Candidatus Acidoferrales bacterium]
MNTDKSGTQRKNRSRRSKHFDPLTLLDGANVHGTSEKHAKRSVVFTEGNPSKYVYYIREGAVKLSVTSKDGKEAVVGILGPKDFFGEDGIAGTKVCMS